MGSAEMRMRWTQTQSCDRAERRFRTGVGAFFCGFWLFFHGLWLKLRWRAVALRLVFRFVAAIAELDLEMMTSNDRSRNGCRVWAVALTLLLGCFRVSAGTGDSLWRERGNLIALEAAPSLAGVYGMCALTLAMATVAWALHWRRQAFRQSNDDILRQIAERTTSQQEVAEAKQALQSLQESHELSLRQERLAAVGQLAAGLAHEFNNIMTIIQGHASLLDG